MNLKKQVIILFYFTSLFCYAQKGTTKTIEVSFLRNNMLAQQNGFDFTGVNFGYQFVNCGGVVQVAVNYSKTANFTAYWYNGKKYDKQTIGADLWPKSNEVEINTIQADLYFRNQNLGRVKLNYIIGNFAGCVGETYDVLNQVGQNSSLKEYKDNINDLRLNNIQVIAARAIGLWREPKINNKLKLIQKQKEQEKVNEKVRYLVQEAERQNYVGNHKFAKDKLQEAYKLYPTKELKAQIDITNNLILKKEKEDKLETIINDAENYASNKNYTSAISKYNEAYSLKPSEDIKQKIIEIKKIIEENNKQDDLRNSNIKKPEETIKKKATNNIKKPIKKELTERQKSQIEYEIERQEYERKKRERQKKQLYSAMAKGELNIGVRYHSSSEKVREIEYPDTFGLMMGYIFGDEKSKKNNALTMGFVGYLDMTLFGEDSSTADYVTTGSVFNFGLTFGMGYKYYEIMPAVGIRSVTFDKEAGYEESYSDTFELSEYAITLGIMGRLGDLFYTLDYDTTFKTVSVGIGFHFGK